MTEELIVKNDSIEKDAQGKLLNLLKKYERSFSSVLPKEFTPQRWQWLVVNSIRKTPALAGTTPLSFINSVLLAANLGIEIRDRSAYLIPFGAECQLLIDYRAKIDLAARAGWTIKAEMVRELDHFEYGWDSNGLQFSHRPALFSRVDGKLVPADRGEAVLTYAYATNGDKRIVDVMTIDDVEAIRKRSRNPGVETTWVDRKPQKRLLTLADIRSLDFDSMGMKDSRNVAWTRTWDRMALKTVVHRAFNGLPCTPEMARSQDIDAAVESHDAHAPLASGMENVLFEVEPADNLPMLPEGSREAQDELRERLDAEARSGLAKLTAGSVEQEPPPLTEEEMNRITMRESKR